MRNYELTKLQQQLLDEIMIDKDMAALEDAAIDDLVDDIRTMDAVELRRNIRAFREANEFIECINRTTKRINK